MLRRIKIGFLATAHATGLSRAIGASAWRQRRLLILCYHGITDGDLYQWNPSLFMQAAVFKKRLSLLRRAQCNVLGLEEALKRLEDGSLPPRSVVLTFDDGFADFYRVAWPILRDFGFPATLYLTTYYMLRGLPVFDPALDYLLWKGRGRILDWPGISQQAVPTDPARRREMSCMLSANVLKRELTATQKDIFLEDLAERLGQDYAALRESRALSLITEGEARKLSAEGANLQLHTHRHRTSNQQDRFLREIIDNRECMAAMGLRPTEHFCYPSGVRRVNDAQWLDELGIKSAATCQPGLVAPGSEPHSLPRVVDSAFTETEFLGWLHGTSALLPRREWSPEIVAVTEPVDTELLASSSAAHR